MRRSRSASLLSILLLTAGATFLPAQSALSFSRRDVTGSNPGIAMTTADFNRDGKMDIAMVTVSGTVSVALCRGDGTFDLGREVIRDPLPARFVIAADLNGDGFPDLISTHQFAHVISVALGKGDGTFLSAVQYSAGTAPYGLVAADFNGDHKLDIAVANNAGLVPGLAGTTVTVLLGRGDGTFGAPLASPVLGRRPYTLASGDFNQDGKADLVVVNSESPDVSILISKGDGTFQPPVPLAPGFFSISGTAVVADLDRDGQADIALLTPPRVQIWIGKGDGTFKAGDNLAFDGLQLLVADMNRDGVLDLVGVSPPYGAAIVALGRGDGTFEIEQAFAAGNLPTDIGVGDVNSDGILDLVLCHQSETALTVLLDSTPVPSIAPTGVVNAASFGSNQVVAPGEIVTISGRNLGPTQLTTARLKSPGLLDTMLDATRVLFDGIAAPLIYVQTDQISAVVPYGLSGKTTANVEVSYGAMRSLPVPLRILATVPGVFTSDSSGVGAVAALNEDGTLNTPANPAGKASIVTFFATGEGQTDPAGLDGKLATGSLPMPLLDVVVGIANMGAEILYAGAAPGYVAGLMQINARVPADAPAGAKIPLVIRIGDTFSQENVTIAIR